MSIYEPAVDLAAIRLFSQPDVLIQKRDTILYQIYRFMHTSDINCLIHAVSIDPSSSLPLRALAAPHLVNEEVDLFTRLATKYCQQLPAKDTHLLSSLQSHIALPEQQDTFDILSGNADTIGQYATNWITFSIGLLLHADYSLVHLVHKLQHLQTQNDQMACLLQLFLMMDVERALASLPSEDAFVALHLHNYVQSNRPDAPILQAHTVTWRLVNTLIEQEHYQMALQLAHSVGHLGGAAFVLQYIPGHVALDQWMMRYPDLLGKYYMVIHTHIAESHLLLPPWGLPGCSQVLHNG